MFCLFWDVIHDGRVVLVTVFRIPHDTLLVRCVNCIRVLIRAVVPILKVRPNQVYRNNLFPEMKVLIKDDLAIQEF